MTKKNEKPSPEAKALSLFLMAYKTIDPIYKEKSKRINRLWDLVVAEEITKDEYLRRNQINEDGRWSYWVCVRII